GAIFAGVGILLTLGIVTAFVGVPFIGLGVIFLALSSPVLFWRYQAAQRIINVLRHGQVTRGEIAQVEENFAVRVNRRHPWIIRYRFQAGGQEYTGVVRTLTPPGVALQPGRAAYVLYLPDTPEHNAIYPHP
ncbi:MAG: DUF3592 domain-containing protein, partial [Chloroflexi bacterium]|nr:DUF3592 domain-containing protein [Chloroflexota bacterium]